MAPGSKMLAETAFRTVFDQAAIAAVIVGLDGLPNQVNAAACTLLDRPAEELVGRMWSEYLAPSQVPTREFVEAHLLADQDTFSDERRYARPDGSIVWVSAHLTLVRDQHGQPEYLLAQLVDITERKGMERQLDHLALHDTITGLPNRFLFEERVRQALAAIEAEPVGVAVVQVVGLDTLIDREGFVEGELALSEIARRLSAVLADDVSLAHLQTGQFAALVSGGTHEMVRASELALDAVRRPIVLPSGSLALRAKVGICAAMAGPAGRSSRAGSLIQDATIAAGRASADGMDSITFALPEMRRERQERHETEMILRDALDSDRIRVAFQPLVDLSSGLVVGAEALLRLSNNDGHPIPPELVISVAEESGLIGEVGRRVLNLSAEQASRWLNEQGLLLPVAVNVSAVQLATVGFLDDVLDAARNAGVPPEALSIELTESVLVEAGSIGVQKLRDLRDAGVQLAIDDFGTGYASLTYLRDLPASTLKIDRSFVEGIPHDRGAVAIVAAVIALARNFEMTCIAEGIETEAQLAYLQDRGVLGQGYLLGRPKDGAEISRVLDLVRSASQLDDARDSEELEPSAGGGHDELSRARRRAGQRDAQADVRERLQAQFDRNIALADRGSGRQDHAGAQDGRALE